MSTQDRTARRVFLRQALRQARNALGAGIAIALIPGIGRAASPDSTVTCCPNTSCPVCPGPKKKFFCQGTCPSYCTCLRGDTCVTIPC